MSRPIAVSAAVSTARRRVSPGAVLSTCLGAALSTAAPAPAQESPPPLPAPPLPAPPPLAAEEAPPPLPAPARQDPDREFPGLAAPDPSESAPSASSSSSSADDGPALPNPSGGTRPGAAPPAGPARPAFDPSALEADPPAAGPESFGSVPGVRVDARPLAPAPEEAFRFDPVPRFEPDREFDPAPTYEPDRELEPAPREAFRYAPAPSAAPVPATAPAAPAGPAAELWDSVWDTEYTSVTGHRARGEVRLSGTGGTILGGEGRIYGVTYETTGGGLPATVRGRWTMNGFGGRLRWIVRPGDRPGAPPRLAGEWVLTEAPPGTWNRTGSWAGVLSPRPSSAPPRFGAEIVAEPPAGGPFAAGPFAAPGGFPSAAGPGVSDREAVDRDAADLDRGRRRPFRDRRSFPRRRR